ncbi:TIGR03752 family integrating conjugative element protein [Salmonella enterica]|uniref:TIGR03752 family integrating conjugative element protein n=1 Tax=Salmonella diarizonae TaxID=59204 RepID=A0A5Y1YEQ3_SALDZ|nr:TIGR03752 family integrating conjugative element protein [Salmonella enterica]EBX5401711.1 TIGR03752 family integrating conjugative element protein [Salmonella enterica subsp. enterica serovar Java]ECC3917162.1 TIGR03752 family integrating conjugative element protein [Salmonella enterica subsp. diarizonae]EBE1092645.1 TIGR03752 family integrating conjugative element protein [Salmonella enterica]ECO8337954.1 TIGR03752 family integrating conjugative element protein [Salmonella enterica]
MRMSTSPLLKLLIPVLVLGVGFITLKACRSSPDAAAQKNSNTVADLTDDELKALGIDGDTPRDTVATLVGQMKQYRSEMEELRTSSSALVKENQRLRERDSNVESRINSAVSKERENFSDEMRKQQSSMLSQFQQQLDQLSPKAPTGRPGTGGDIPPGLGLDDQSVPADAVHWTEPADAVSTGKPGQPGSVQFPSTFGYAGDNAISRQKKVFLEQTKGERATGSREKSQTVPVYTLPENSTLTGSVAMTALLGRVPVNGTVSDPYPFRVLIGRDNLIANGVELPDVEGAVISGTASGDWTLSCVRGTVHSITLVFRDGTIRTVPQATEKANSDSNKSQGSEIGWLSDPHGLPCIPGERKSNAAEYIGSQFLLSGSAAAADAFANGQTTTTVDGGSVTSALTGNSGQYVLGQTLGGGLKESADWFKQRYGQMFDAVYVPPGHAVAIHITRQIPVDYEIKGRKVKYSRAFTPTGGLD